MSACFQDSWSQVDEGQAAVWHHPGTDCVQPPADAAQPLDLAEDCPVLVDWAIQLAVSACGLLRFCNGLMIPYQNGMVFIDSYDGMFALDMTWWYFFSKFIDYFDSLFFLLRKKFTHLSMLHVIHHGIMPLTAWSGVKWGSSIINQSRFQQSFQMGWRGSHFFRWLPQHGCPCLHVFLLLHVQLWTQCTKVSMVEKVRAAFFC